MQAAHQRLESEGLVIVGVNLRRQETSDDAVREFVQRYGVTYPIALDVDGEAARLFQIFADTGQLLYRSRGYDPVCPHWNAYDG